MTQYKSLIILEVDSLEDNYNITLARATANDIVERFKDMRIVYVAVITDSVN